MNLENANKLQKIVNELTAKYEQCISSEDYNKGINILKNIDFVNRQIQEINKDIKTITILPSKDYIEIIIGGKYYSSLPKNDESKNRLVSIIKKYSYAKTYVDQRGLGADVAFYLESQNIPFSDVEIYCRDNYEYKERSPLSKDEHKHESIVYWIKQRDYIIKKILETVETNVPDLDDNLNVYFTKDDEIRVEREHVEECFKMLNFDVDKYIHNNQFLKVTFKTW